MDATEANDDAPRQHLNCSRLAMCVHCGTHMDAPFHFFGGGATIEQVPVEVFCGPAVRIELEDRLGPERDIDAQHVEAWAPAIRRCGRVVLATGWWRRWGAAEYFTDHPVLTRAAARLLVDSGARLVAVDFPSVDRPPYPAHLELLGRGTVIVENLAHVDQLPERDFELLAIPLAIAGRDGSPVRVLARWEVDT